MGPKRIDALLQPFLSAPTLVSPAQLSLEQLQSISTYIELLQKWNARINLTAVRDPEAIVTRHFGESLFLAACLFPSGRLPISPRTGGASQHALDLGSGAGFPGLPLKLYVPELRLTLVESNHKKAAFLAEVIRSLKLSQARVSSARLDYRTDQQTEFRLPEGIATPDLVTMRAVERFETALATTASLVRAGGTHQKPGKLALLLGRHQADRVPQLAPDFAWQAAVAVPLSRERVLLIGQYPRGNVSLE